MGYRAHVLKKKIVKYSNNAYFNWFSQDLADYLYQLKDDINEYYNDVNYDPFVIEDENGVVKDDWEIEREWLEQAILYLDKQILNGKGKDIAFGDGDNAYTLEYVRNAFDDWLKESSNEDNFTYPEFVYISWF